MSANNYYAGFGPGTANIFRKMVGLPEAVCSKEEDDKSHTYIAVVTSSIIIQTRVLFQIL